MRHSSKALYSKNYSIRVRNPRVVEFISQLAAEAGAGKSDAAVIVDLLEEALAIEGKKRIYRFATLDPGARKIIIETRDLLESRYRLSRKLLMKIESLLDRGGESDEILECEQELKQVLSDIESGFEKMQIHLNLQFLKSSYDEWILGIYWLGTKQSYVELHEFLDTILSDELKVQVEHYMQYESHGWKEDL